MEDVDHQSFALPQKHQGERSGGANAGIRSVAGELNG